MVLSYCGWDENLPNADLRLSALILPGANAVAGIIGDKPDPDMAGQGHPQEGGIR